MILNTKGHVPKTAISLRQMPKNGSREPPIDLPEGKKFSETRIGERNEEEAILNDLFGSCFGDLANGFDEVIGGDALLGGIFLHLKVVTIVGFDSLLKGVGDL